MRLWDYRLLKVLPNKMLVSQWQECIAIKRQWEKGTLKHRLVSYVKNYDKDMFVGYVVEVLGEMENRNIKFQNKYYEEIWEWSKSTNYGPAPTYPEHNNRYLTQCYFNLQEKYDRGIVTEEEWEKIEDLIGGESNGKRY